MATKAIQGAATYFAGRTGDGRYAVFMKESADTASEIQPCKTAEKAMEAAERWQKKENAAVEKEAKRLAKAGK